MLPAYLPFSKDSLVLLQREDFVLLTRAQVHPQRTTIEQQATEDAERLGLLDASNRRRFAAFNTLVGYVYPTASLERARVCAAWCNWLFFFDDAHDERDALGSALSLPDAEAAAQRALGVLESGVVQGPGEPLDALALEFREAALGLMGRSWFDRFLQHARDYLLRGTLEACRHWVHGTTPTLERYLVQRDYDSAVYTACALIELAGGLRLSDEVLGHPDFHALNQACTRTIALFNDLASFPKEVLVQQNPNNLVHVLAVARRLPVEQVLPEAVLLVNDAARELERVGRRLANRFPGDEHLAAYLVGVRQWQRGNVESSLLEPRYRAAASPFAALRTSALARA